MAAPAATGPASGPRPASSIPHIQAQSSYCLSNSRMSERRSSSFSSFSPVSTRLAIFCPAPYPNIISLPVCADSPPLISSKQPSAEYFRETSAYLCVFRVLYYSAFSSLSGISSVILPSFPPRNSSSSSRAAFVRSFTPPFVRHARAVAISSRSSYGFFPSSSIP